MQRTVLLSQFCLSIGLSDACTVTKLNDGLWIFLYHMKRQSLQFSDTNGGWWVMPPSLSNIRIKWPTLLEKQRLRPISAHDISTVRDSKKCSIMTNIKSTTGFPTLYRWSVYATPKSRKGKGGSKNVFFAFFGPKINFNRIKSATKFRCVKTSSGKVVAQPFPHLMVQRY